MRISDWSADVCSSDLPMASPQGGSSAPPRARIPHTKKGGSRPPLITAFAGMTHRHSVQPDRKSVVSGKSVSVRVDLGGRRIIKKNNISTISLHIYTYLYH